MYAVVIIISYVWLHVCVLCVRTYLYFEYVDALDVSQCACLQGPPA